MKKSKLKLDLGYRNDPTPSLPNRTCPLCGETGDFWRFAPLAGNICWHCLHADQRSRLSPALERAAYADAIVLRGIAAICSRMEGRHGG